MTIYCNKSDLMDKILILQVDIETTLNNIFLFLLSRELSPFHLKEEFYQISLAYPNCYHHYSCALTALLRDGGEMDYINS